MMHFGNINYKVSAQSNQCFDLVPVSILPAPGSITSPSPKLQSYPQQLIKKNSFPILFPASSGLLISSFLKMHFKIKTREKNV